MFDYIGEFKPDIVRFGCMIVCPDKTERIPNYNPSGIFFVDKAAFKDEIYPLFISGIKLNSVCLAAFRCDIAKGVCFPEKFRTAEDAAFALEIYTNAESVLFVPDRYTDMCKAVADLRVRVLEYSRNSSIILCLCRLCSDG